MICDYFVLYMPINHNQNLENSNYTLAYVWVVFLWQWILTNVLIVL